MKILANNKKALFNYEVIRRFQAGIVLQGWEVKSIKSRNISMKESYIKILKGEPVIENLFVSPWPGMADFTEYLSTRPRKLLLHASEIHNLLSGVKIKGQTVIPLQIFQEKNKVKIEVALARGLKKYDKRARLKEKDQKREINRDLKHMGYN